MTAQKQINEYFMDVLLQSFDKISKILPKKNNDLKELIPKMLSTLL